MRPIFSFFLISVLFASLCQAEESAATADLKTVLTSTNIWQSSTLAGNWRQVSTNAQGRTMLLLEHAPVFGPVPEQVQAYISGETLGEINITYLEVGNFFASQESRDLGQKKSQKLFKTEFKNIESALLKELTDLCGPGQKTTVGKSQLLRSRVTEFKRGGLVLRLYAEDNQLISVSILPALAASKELLSVPEGQAGLVQRREEVGNNVVKLPDGDIVIQNIPAVDQGERGYCAIGTLTMLTRYYGLTVNIDMIAAKAGYKEGDVANANLSGAYAACAKEAKLKMKVDKVFDFRKIKIFIQRGEPIIVSRKLERARDQFHTQFAQQHESDPTARLPKPDRNERAHWPASSAGGHVSVINGYNEARGEVIFSESWGEAARNRRMLAEEMEATAVEVYYFSPQ